MPIARDAAFAASAERFAWLATNPEAVETMSRADRERVLARFTWPVVARRCLEIYRSCQ